MSNSVSSVTNKTIKPLLDDNKTTITVNIATSICNVSGGLEGWREEWDEEEDYYAKQVIASEGRYSRMENKPTHYVENYKRDFDGCSVYKIPVNFTGAFDEYDQENHECIGKLIKTGRRYKLIPKSN